MHLRFFLFAVLAVVTSACMDQPRDGKSIISRATAMQFSGWVQAPSERVQPWIKNQRTGAWEKLGTEITPTSTPTADATGRNWYEWKRTGVVLKSPDDYWIRTGSNNVQAHVKSTAPSGQSLVTFKHNAEETCGASQIDGVEIASECASPNSPIAKIDLFCGQANFACCKAHGVAAADRCNAGSQCDGTICVRCGGENQRPCSSGAQCAAGLMLTPSGVCSRCNCDLITCPEGSPTGTMWCTCATQSASHSVAVSCD